MKPLLVFIIIIKIFARTKPHRISVFPHRKTGKKLSNIGLGEGGKLGLLAEIFTLGE